MSIISNFRQIKFRNAISAMILIHLGFPNGTLAQSPSAIDAAGVKETLQTFHEERSFKFIGLYKENETKYIAYYAIWNSYSGTYGCYSDVLYMTSGKWYIIGSYCTSDTHALRWPDFVIKISEFG